MCRIVYICILYVHVEQEYDAMEVCAGAGTLSRILSCAGYRVARLDITYWAEQPRPLPPCNNPLDMLQPGGFAPLALIRHARRFAHQPFP